MAKEKQQNWIFTFGHGMPNEGHYIKFFGTWSETRLKMIERYGTRWAFQYTEDEWNDYVKEAKAIALKAYGDERFARVETELIIED